MHWCPAAILGTFQYNTVKPALFTRTLLMSYSLVGICPTINKSLRENVPLFEYISIVNTSAVQQTINIVSFHGVCITEISASLWTMNYLVLFSKLSMVFLLFGENYWKFDYGRRYPINLYKRDTLHCRAQHRLIDETVNRFFFERNTPTMSILSEKRRMSTYIWVVFKNLKILTFFF